MLLSPVFKSLIYSILKTPQKGEQLQLKGLADM